MSSDDDCDDGGMMENDEDSDYTDDEGDGGVLCKYLLSEGSMKVRLSFKFAIFY